LKAKLILKESAQILLLYTTTMIWKFCH